MTTPLIAIVGVLFFGMGLVALATPAIVPKQFGMSFEGGGDNGRAEIRAVYGGFGLAMAAVLAYALTNDAVRDGIVLTVGAALAGMAGGRVHLRDPWRPNALLPQLVLFHDRGDRSGGAAFGLVTVVSVIAL